MLFCAFLFHMGSLTAYAAAESAEVEYRVRGWRGLHGGAYG